MSRRLIYDPPFKRSQRRGTAKRRRTWFCRFLNVTASTQERSRQRYFAQPLRPGRELLGRPGQFQRDEWGRARLGEKGKLDHSEAECLARRDMPELESGLYLSQRGSGDNGTIALRNRDIVSGHPTS
jgi:hypothetical protein